MKKIFFLFFFSTGIFFLYQPVLAEPVLYFSDIMSGPKTGLGDGVGSGAIVTVWGVDLGTVQGNSRISINGKEASAIYYWGNADAGYGAGPADLSTHHRIQTISFSIPADAQDGQGTIRVMAQGRRSNDLPFTIRQGSIRHVKKTGNDRNEGSWSAPWATIQHAVDAMRPGDIAYVGSGTWHGSGTCAVVIGKDRPRSGSAAKPFALVAYPGSRVILTSSSKCGIGNAMHWNEYWIFSKLAIHAAQPAIGSFRGVRAVGIEATEGEGQCSGGQGGVLGDGGSPEWSQNTTSEMRFLGNYIHACGCPGTRSTKLHHTFYISNRTGRPAEHGAELGWNLLKNNYTNAGLHIYDEDICGDWKTPHRIHDNVVINQRGVGMDYIIDCAPGHGPVTAAAYFYNNLLVNVGLGNTYSDGKSTGAAFIIGKASNRASVYMYNNTVYGYGDQRDTYFNAGIQFQSFAGSVDFRNNIIVDTKNLDYVLKDSIVPHFSSNNLWYSTKTRKPAPAWPGTIQADPRFADPDHHNFILLPGSPARGQGTSSVSSIVSRDLAGRLRAGSPDIGALQSGEPKAKVR
ncbi:MAG: hypothetical protein WC539_06790 [Nitrospirota bacterium]